MITLTALEQRIAQAMDKSQRRGSTMDKFLKWTTTGFAFGTLAGAYIIYQAMYVPLVDYVSRGYCGARDVSKTFYLFQCQDAFIAAQLQASAIEESKAIVADMATSPPTPKKKAR